ncbi:MAG: hypothetical protein ACJ8AI_23450 [Rhodopila sp.]
MLDSVTIARLLKPAAPAVSLYLPLAPEQRDVRGPAVRLREMIGEAEAMMQRDGLDQRRIQQVLAPLHQVADETDFARHREQSLALFTDGQFTLTQPVPGDVPESVVVGPDYHIKPLLPVLMLNRHFYILALSKTKVRLLAATPYTCQEVPLEYLPADAQAELDSRSALDAGPDVRLSLIVESPKRIEAAVKAALGDDTAPIVVIADPQVGGHFSKQVDLRQVLEPVAFNPFSVSDSELVEKAIEQMRPLLNAELDTVLEQINARLGTAEPTVAIRLEEILRAAPEGRVDTVVVAEDETLWGQFTPDAVPSAHGHRAPHDEDLLNQAVVMAMRNGARAFAVPHERLPRQVLAAALLRY